MALPGDRGCKIPRGLSNGLFADSFRSVRRASVYSPKYKVRFKYRKTVRMPPKTLPSAASHRSKCALSRTQPVPTASSSSELQLSPCPSPALLVLLLIVRKSLRTLISWGLLPLPGYKGVVPQACGPSLWRQLSRHTSWHISEPAPDLLSALHVCRWSSTPWRRPRFLLLSLLLCSVILLPMHER